MYTLPMPHSSEIPRRGDNTLLWRVVQLLPATHRLAAAVVVQLGLVTTALPVSTDVVHRGDDTLLRWVVQVLPAGHGLLAAVAVHLALVGLSVSVSTAAVHRATGHAALRLRVHRHLVVVASYGREALVLRLGVDSGDEVNDELRTMCQ